jgi:hypothetical protein
MKTNFLVLIAFIISAIGYSQNDTVILKRKNFLGIAVNYQNGRILPTTDFVKGDNLTGSPLRKYQAYTIKVLWQNPGYSDWQKVYRAPYYGAGLSVGNLLDPKEVGFPVSLYGILGIPLLRWGRNEIYSEFQFGIASNWKHYDPVANPKNFVIGGGMTVHLNVGLYAFYQITDNLDLGAGLSFVHFSNGGMERPNYGFNIVAPSLELKYHIRARPDVRLIKSPGRLERSNDLYFMMGYGNHQLPDKELDTNYFAIGGLSIIYFTQFSNSFRLGYGADWNYWWGMTVLPDGRIGPQGTKNITLGLILQPEFIIGRLTLTGGIGVYAKNRNFGNFRQFYQRCGIRYDLYKNISVGVNIRSIKFYCAEFFEFNLGYRIRWMK